jgi:hypothetical protein
MSKVFVLDTTKQPLNLVHPGRARLLLKQASGRVLQISVHPDPQASGATADVAPAASQN